MAMLLAEFLPGISFRDLVGPRMTVDHSSKDLAAEYKPTEAKGTHMWDAPMRIYLPDGAVQEMTLAEYREFLVSYQIRYISASELLETAPATCCVASDDCRDRSITDIGS